MSKEEIPQMQLVEAEKPKRKRKTVIVPAQTVENALTIEVPREPSVALMLQSLVEGVRAGGITSDSVKAVESFVGLYERMQAKNAEREFNQAFAKLQSEMPKIEADKVVTGGNGVVMYRYASPEEIHDQVRPHLIANGFSVRSSQRMEQERERVTAISTLMHVSGHSESSEYTVRTGKGPSGMNETKCDQSASTIAEKEALCNLLNIARSSRQDDGKMIGSPIGMALADDLEFRVKACGADREAFLKYAGAREFYEISDERWPVLDELLKRKEQAKAAREKLSTEEWK